MAKGVATVAVGVDEYDPGDDTSTEAMAPLELAMAVATALLPPKRLLVPPANATDSRPAYPLPPLVTVTD
jgi:hypothetical protein